MPKEIVTKYGFGYAPDSWDYIKRRLSGKHGEQKLEKAGLITPRKEKTGFYDRFRNRLIIPIHTETGALVGFGGRSLDNQDPKYLNSPESEVFNKSRLLYNLHRSKDAMRKIDRAILVEGYFDAIAIDHAGVPGVVASMGTSLTLGQASLLRRFTRRVVICYDGDDAGRNATLRAAPVLLSAGLHVEVLDLMGEKDPDTLVQKHGVDRFLELLGNATDIFQFGLKEWATGSRSTLGQGEIGAGRALRAAAQRGDRSGRPQRRRAAHRRRVPPRVRRGLVARSRESSVRAGRAAGVRANGLSRERNPLAGAAGETSGECRGTCARGFIRGSDVQNGVLDHKK